MVTPHFEQAQLEYARYAVSPHFLQVIQTLHKTGQLSRTDLANELGYSRALVSGIVKDLLAHNVIREIGDAASTGGRRARLLDFNSAFAYVVGVDIGATSVDIGVANFRGEIVERHHDAIDVFDGPEPILTHVVRLIQQLLAKAKIAPGDVDALGIGVPGPVDFEKGVLIAPPIMPGWENYPIRQFLRKTFPQAAVVVDNDVNVMALGEMRYGSGTAVDNFIFVKVGTGIGAGIVVARTIYRGSDGCAGDIGHIMVMRDGPVCHCGNIGCIEAMASGMAIAQRATEAARNNTSAILASYLTAGSAQITAKEVGLAAQQGDRVALDIIKSSGSLLGDVLAGLVNFFNPRMIIIGGGVSKIGNQYLASIRRAILKRSLSLSTRHLQINYSPIVDEVGLRGALELARDHLFVEVAK
ncbi:MAG: ROK family transcriptional regulator [Anaerolineae bacterium]|nr:ROK family transcriptional regulator [Anaerolineae bacterium]